MGRLFISLYLFILVCLFTLAAVTDWLATEEQRTEPALLALGKAFANTPHAQHPQLAAQSQLQQQSVPLEQLMLPQQARQQIIQEKVLITYDQRLGPQIWVLTSDTHLSQLSFINYPISEADAYWYGLLFFVMLAIAIGVWSGFLWRDIRRVEQGAKLLQDDGHLPHIQLPKGSSMLVIADALNQLGEQVAQLLRGQKELAGAVAHEFRTPLARLKFAMAMQPGDASWQAIDNDLNELERLVQEMLDYSALTHSTPELAMAEIDLQSSCQSLLNRLQTHAPPHIQLQFSGPKIQLMADGHFLERALQNVLLNGIRYARSTLILTIAASSTNVSISIDDDGPGIPEDQREQVFTPFFRPDSSRDRARGGAGLGLAIVQRIQRWHNGSCRVEKSPLGGARFILTYPKR